MASLVVGATGTIGRAVARAMRVDGREVLEVSRSADGFDLLDESSIKCYFQGLQERNVVLRDVFVATGKLAHGSSPERKLGDFNCSTASELFRINAIGPLLVLKHCIPLLPRSERVTFSAMSARVGSILDNRSGGWYSYRAAKAALNQYLRSASVELGRTHRQSVVLALHPGTVESALTRKLTKKFTASADDTAHMLIDIIGRATPKDSVLLFCCTVAIEGCTFKDNVAYTAGTVVFSAAQAASVSDSAFIHNYATKGGGLVLNGTACDISHVAFVGNEATYGGGGLYLYAGSAVNASAVSFIANTVRDTGGALYMEGGASLAASFMLMANNSATEADGQGGGLYASAGSIAVQDSSFLGNEAAYGGGMYLQEGITAELASAVFEANSATTSGGGFYCDGGTVSLTFASILDNSAPEGSAYTCADGCSTYLANSTLAVDNAPHGCSSASWATFGTLADRDGAEARLPDLAALGETEAERVRALDGL